MLLRSYKTLYFTVLVLLLSGCVAEPDLYKSVALVKGDDMHRNRVVIDDLLGFLQRYYAPAQTVFVINPDKSSENLKFAEQFETRFRNAGYGISHDPSVHGIPLAWKIDKVGHLLRTTYYVDNAVITRVYRSLGSEWVPIGPFSAQNIGIPKFKPIGLGRRAKQVHSRHQHGRSGYGIVIADVLKIRENPTKKAKVIGRIKYGQKVRVVSRLRNSSGEHWVKLRYSKGYVFAKYLRMTGE